jgi:hypothetical protein
MSIPPHEHKNVKIFICQEGPLGLLAEESLNGCIRRHRNVTLDKELGQHWFTQQGSIT